MKATKQDLISAQLKRAEESFAMAKLAIEAQFWNSAASELYYTCFHFIRALFSLHDIDAQTHKGVKTLFSLNFIKQNHLDDKYGKLFARLFELRQQGDYGDYQLTEKIVLPLVKDVEEFKTKVLALLEHSGNKNNDAL